MSNNDIGELNRQQKALHEFKEVLQHLLRLFRKASNSKTAYIYWINPARRQFVMETKTTVLSDIVFQDRIAFEDHFLNSYKAIDQPVTLRVGKDINPEALTHFQGAPSVQYITLLPFINNGETIAITVVETNEPPSDTGQADIMQTYSSALGNVLNTYLEISDLQEKQNEWTVYEDRLQFLKKKGHYAGLLQAMLNTMQGWVNRGGVSLIAQGMGTWNNVLNAADALQPPPLGLQVSDSSVAGDALVSGKPEYAVHFNQNPKRLSPREPRTEGATLAIPVLFENTRQGVVLVYDENPLLFKDAAKHKFINTVRLTSLKIQARLKNSNNNKLLLANDMGAFIPDLWQRTIDMEMERLKKEQSAYHTWAGMVTLSGLSQIRTQLRLEDLKLMQKDLVRVLNPELYGIHGLIGFHADYVYISILQSSDAQAPDHWAKSLKERFNAPFELANGKQIHTGFNISFEKLQPGSSDSYHITKRLKRDLQF